MSIIMDGSIDGEKDKLKDRTKRFISTIPKVKATESLRSRAFGWDNDIFSVLERAQAALMDISDVYSYAKIEFAKFGSSTTPAVLPQLEVVNKCYFFVTMLGFCDRGLIDCATWMRHYESFKSDDEYDLERYSFYKDQKEKLFELREEIIAHLRKTEIIGRETSNLPQHYDKCFEKIPMFCTFGDLYKVIGGTGSDLDIVSGFTNAYNIGFGSCANFDEIKKRYLELYSKLQMHIREREDKVKPYIKK